MSRNHDIHLYVLKKFSLRRRGESAVGFTAKKEAAARGLSHLSRNASERGS